MNTDSFRLRYFCIGLIAATCGLLAACGGAPETTPPTSDPAAPEAASEAPLSPAPEAAVEEQAGNSVTIYRDTWGVPHIYADTAEDAAYGVGYAQAEDRLADIYGNVRTALGRMAEAFGPEYVEQDTIMRLMRNEELAREYWEQGDPRVKAIATSYMAGIKAYAAEHPEAVPAHALELEPWQCGAIGRAMILRWPLGTVQDDLRKKHEDPGFGSNGWVVAKERSAEGVPILLTDPHLTWENLAIFHEARVHGGDLNLNGFFIVGSPLMALGNNGKVGWASTTGGPDTADVYALKLNPENPLQYEFDGEWRDLEQKKISVAVKGSDPVEIDALYSHFGPIMEEPDLEKGVAYAGASPYFEFTDVFEQIYLMNIAQNATEFYDALSLCALMEQNILYADTTGETGYLRTGRTPIRPEGYDWKAPVPGNTSATTWKGIHPVEDLVQIKNPPQGYFQNCNISPENMMVGSPMTPDKYSEYMFNVSWDFDNTRSRRAVELLDADDSVTKEEAMAYAMDVGDSTAKAWQTALRTALDGAGTEYMADATFAKAAESLLAWDGQFSVDSSAATLMKTWRKACHPLFDQRKVEIGEPLNVAEPTAWLDALKAAIAELTTQYGKVEVPHGDIHQLGRGNTYVPVPGTVHSRVRTLLNVHSREEPKGSGIHVAYSGSMSIMLMFFYPEGIEAYSCVMWGQSGDAESPHYMDQGEKLYAKQQLKPTWMKKEELLKNLESEKVLPIPS
jgi:acyl-homoserine lactone acylase PvdQ